jgi:hypothetical protein
MPRQKEFMPLSQASTGRVRFDVVLPEYINPDCIGINKDIDKFIRRGGIRALRVATVSDGETTNYRLTSIGSVNEQGSAVGGGIIAQKVALFETHSENRSPLPYSPSLHAAEWIDGTIVLNTKQIAQEIQNNKKEKKGVRSPKAWADQINKALQDGIIAIGTNHLLFGASPLERLRRGTIDVFYGMATSVGFWFDPKVGVMVLGGVAGAKIIENGLELRLAADIGRPYRASAFHGYEVDLATFLTLTTKTQRLAKEIPESKMRQ